MEDRVDVLGLTSRELEASASRRLRGGAGAARKIYAHAFRSGRIEPELFGLSPSAATGWHESLRVGLLEVRSVLREPGEHGETLKALLAASDGELLECVRIPVAGSERSTICVSSQVGCRRGCVFCETGRRGFVRDLGAAEIVAQVVTAKCLLGWDCRNVVFMGMGEPLDNFDALVRSLAVLTDPLGLAFSWERITVCTSGVIEGIDRLRSKGWKRLNLSVSLNAADDETRDALMPVNRGTGLGRLAASLRAYPMRRGFVLGLNYCLLPGLNDTEEHAARVASYVKPLGRAMVNLIPYNPGTDAPDRAPTRAPTEEETGRFAGWLEREGVVVRVRAPRGSAIMAGCGQLGGCSGR